ncbi:DUSP19 (predicted) [Pycnogonum litorale]
MSGFLDQLRKFHKCTLKSVDTVVKETDGTTTVEHRNADGTVTVEKADRNYGFVCDFKPDLQIGRVMPSLLVGSQDVAQDDEILKRNGVTHVLNLATGVSNYFPNMFMYKKIEILDLPESNIVQYFPECITFIDDAIENGGCVFVHCNAGVSRAPSITIAYIMAKNKMPFDEAFEIARSNRSCIRPNIGFTKQLQAYEKFILS